MDGDISLAGKKKRQLAITSVIAAVFLTVGKLVVGLFTGSLGILSEAVHSALDLVAAIITTFAVHSSDIPPDKNHTYGHGKIENLSALFEAILLFLACIWISYEAIQRLFFKEVHVESSWWGIAVIVISIVVDYSRSRALLKAAKEYQSQALEADGLHFATDIWSSGVVLVGLGLVYLADFFKQPWLVKADAIAALVVAGIVIWVSIRLCMKTISDLLDSIQPETVNQIGKIIESVEGVEKINRLRVRRSGAAIFCDIALTVAPELSVEASHVITLNAERAVHQVFKNADVVVHIEPGEQKKPYLIDISEKREA